MTRNEVDRSTPSRYLLGNLLLLVVLPTSEWSNISLQNKKIEFYSNVLLFHNYIDLAIKTSW